MSKTAGDRLGSNGAPIANGESNGHVIVSSRDNSLLEDGIALRSLTARVLLPFYYSYYR